MIFMGAQAAKKGIQTTAENISDLFSSNFSGERLKVILAEGEGFEQPRLNLITSHIVYIIHGIFFYYKRLQFFSPLLY